MMSNAVKNFDMPAANSSVLHNYFDSSIKLFSDLYLAKFLDPLAKHDYLNVNINRFN